MRLNLQLKDLDIISSRDIFNKNMPEAFFFKFLTKQKSNIRVILDATDIPIQNLLNTQLFIYQSYKYIENNNWLHPLGTDFFHGGSASDR